MLDYFTTLQQAQQTDENNDTAVFNFQLSIFNYKSSIPPRKAQVQQSNFNKKIIINAFVMIT